MTTTADSPTVDRRLGAGSHRGRPRLALLDGLRFIAAMAVVAYHFTALNTTFWGVRTVDAFPSLHHLGRFGYLGVELFFFISGFVILMTAWGRDLPGYVASRAARLFPAYWAGVLTTGLLLLATGKALKEIHVGDVLTNLTMLQMPFGVDNVDGVYWTLWVELRFYLLIGVLMLVGITRERILATAVLWPLVGAMATRYDQQFISELLIAQWAPLFAVGMLLYVVHREGWSPLLALLIGVELLLAMSNVGQYSAVIVKRTGIAVDPMHAAAVVGLAFVAVALVTTTRLAQIRWGWASTLGALTYPLYLIHEYWGFYLISRFHESAPRAVVLVAVVAAVLLMAWAIHKLVERPLSGPLRRFVESGLRSSTTKRRVTEA